MSSDNILASSQSKQLLPFMPKMPRTKCASNRASIYKLAAKNIHN